MKKYTAVFGEYIRPVIMASMRTSAEEAVGIDEQGRSHKHFMVF
jgi:hypothetical protein